MMVADFLKNFYLMIPVLVVDHMRTLPKNNQPRRMKQCRLPIRFLGKPRFASWISIFHRPIDRETQLEGEAQIAKLVSYQLSVEFFFVSAVARSTLVPGGSHKATNIRCRKPTPKPEQHTLWHLHLRWSSG